jgi:flagellar basal body-associated protein FliL
LDATSGEQVDQEAAKQDNGAPTEGLPSADDTASQGSPEKPAKPKKLSKGRIILIAIAAVLVLLIGGAGTTYALTHEDPHFCNAICHTPMDPYVQSYDNNVSIVEAEADATGPDGAPLSVTLHKNSDQNINCLDCHVPSIEEQVTEGISWISGSYSVPLDGIKVVKTDKLKDGEVNGQAFCLREGCHAETTYEQLEESTSDLARNVHEGQHGYNECSLCHQSHEQSVLLCAQCHTDVKAPEGWVAKKTAVK